MKFKVSVRYRDMEVVEYVREVLDLFDTRPLSEFKIRTGTMLAAYPQGWGICRHPSFDIPSFRISCSIKGTDEDFPLGRVHGKWHYHHDTLRHAHVAENLQEVIAWISGHELFHYLALTKQVRADGFNERMADMVGYEWLHSYREGVAPVELADHLTGIRDYGRMGAYVPIAHALQLAPHRVPYTGMPEIKE